jgi:hypothetical protein
VNRVGLSLAVLVLAACSAPAPPIDWTPVLEEIPSPTEGVSAVPQLTAREGRTILSWLESRDFRHTLKFAERTDTGWSEPRTIVSSEGLFHNAADVPSVMALEGGRLAAAWLETDRRHAAAYNLLLAWSSDGTTWSSPVRPHHDGTPTQHGFGSLFATPNGFGIAWLDGRHTNPDLPEGENGNIALWAAGFGISGEQAGEDEVDGRVCDCCQTSADVTAEGPIVVAAQGTPSPPLTVTRLSGPHYPRMALHGDHELLFTWVEASGGYTRIRTASARF